MIGDGLVSIDHNTSLDFLALKDRSSATAQEGIVGEYDRLLFVFDHLCNLNVRDRVFAYHILVGLHGMCLKPVFPYVFQALDLWCQGNLCEARKAFLAHLSCYPRDFVGIFMLHLFDFLQGNPYAYSDYLKQDARCEDVNFGPYFLGILAFSLCEQGKSVEAFPHAFAACRLNPVNNVYGLHALVHCWHAEKAYGQIVDFLQAHKGIVNPTYFDYKRKTLNP